MNTVKVCILKVTASVRRLLQFFLAHWGVLYNGWDSISVISGTKDNFRLEESFQQLDNSRYNGNYRKQYAFPFLLGLYVLFDSLAIWVYNGFRYSDREMPQLFTHLTSPLEYWPITDVNMGLGLVALPCIFGTFMLGPGISLKYRMFLLVPGESSTVKLIENGKVIKTSLARKLTAARSRARLVIDLMLLLSYVQVSVFYLRNFLLQWTGRPRDYWMLTVIVAFYFYAIFANVILLYYFALATLYLRIKQKTLQASVSRLTGKVKLSLPQGDLWRRLTSLRAQMARVQGEIAQRNRFWTVPLTILMVMYVIVFVHILFAICALQMVGPFSAAFSVFFGGEFLFTLLLAITASEGVIQQNKLIFQCCRHFGLRFQGKYTLSPRKSLKIDSMLSQEKALSEYAFKLFNGFQIDSEMFHMVFTYISILFFMLLKREAKASVE